MESKVGYYRTASDSADMAFISDSGSRANPVEKHQDDSIRVLIESISSEQAPVLG